MERTAANEVFTRVAEVIATVDSSDAEVEVTISSVPDDATFRLLTFDGRAIQDVCTNDCPVRLYRGDYKYEIVRAGYKRKLETLPLLNRAPRLKLECVLVKADEANEPRPCREITLPER